MKLRHVCQSLLLVVLFAMAESLLHAQGPVTKADDGYHFQSWKGSPYNAAYNEWWYFNLYDEKHDIQAIFTYQVADPLNLTGFGISDITAVVYHGKDIVAESDLYPLSSFKASASAANVTLGPNTVSTAGPNTYFVTGSSQDGRLSWNLIYDRVTSSWFAGDHLDVGPPSWEQMSWLVYMPRANVLGSLTIDGHTYVLNTSGYHDHNWGQWDFASVVWNWAQYSQPGLSFDLGDFVGNPNGKARIKVDGKETVFAANQYKLVHTKWAFDKQDNLAYPVQSVLTAENRDVKLRITMNVGKTEPLATGPPPSLVIYEQTAHYTGTITVKSRPFPRESFFDGDGFKEYTATSPAP